MTLAITFQPFLPGLVCCLSSACLIPSQGRLFPVNVFLLPLIEYRYSLNCIGMTSCNFICCAFMTDLWHGDMIDTTRPPTMWGTHVSTIKRGSLTLIQLCEWRSSIPVASFPGCFNLQSLIACSMQLWRGKAWEIWSCAVTSGRQISQAFPLCICIQQAIKDWRLEQPENQATEFYCTGGKVYVCVYIADCLHIPQCHGNLVG